MDELQKYLFDLNGYIIIPNAINKKKIDELNTIINNQNLPRPGLLTNEARFGGSGSDYDNTAGFLDWDKSLCDLLDHESILSQLIYILGDGFRLDHYYGIHMRKGTERLNLHGGNTPYAPPDFYHYRDGKIFNGLVVVSWNLTDTGPNLGGFCVIPGSHKSNIECPQDIRYQHENHDCVIVPEVSAGSVVIFTEALTHGTAEWKGETDRRSLLFKYSPSIQSWDNNYPKMPENKKFITNRQKLLFEPPYHNRRNSFL